MAGLKTVGVREFRDHATTYLAGNEPVAVSRHGQVIGFYIPVERDDAQAQRALEGLAATVSRVLAETGMSEDDLAGLFDLRHGDM